jgi:hypothetical protein
VSDGSSFVNGHDLVVDGAISARRPVSVSISERTQMAEVLRASGQPVGSRAA